MLQVPGCDKSMVDSKVIGMRKTSMVDRNSNTNKEPDNTRKHSSLWSSLCAPLDIVPRLPLFFLFFGLSLFFWEILTFLFYFFDIFPSLRSTKEVTIEIYELKQVKGVACGNFRRRAQNRQKPCDHEKMIL